MNRLRSTFALTVASLALAACAATPPAGPRVVALPADGKPIQMFQQEDMECRGYGAQAAAALDPNNAYSYDLQQAYDVAYQQCMYSKGNKIIPQQVAAAPYYRPYGYPGYEYGPYPYYPYGYGGTVVIGGGWGGGWGHWHH
jgi:hypothetical protein